MLPSGKLFRNKRKSRSCRFSLRLVGQAVTLLAAGAFWSGAAWVRGQGCNLRPTAASRRLSQCRGCSDALAVAGKLLSKSDLQERSALRRSLPQVLLASDDGDLWEARLLGRREDGIIRAELIGASAACALDLREYEPESWRVESSTASFLGQGRVLKMYDATPSFDAPVDAKLETDGVKSLTLRSSILDAGSVEYDGAGGFSPGACPREMDTVNITFEVWRCRSPADCVLIEVGDDPAALICETGPEGFKQGLRRMVPEEIKRFWIPTAAVDRRFGQPLPDGRVLPPGDVIVDVTLHSIERDAVFDYQLTDAAIKLSQQRERSPERILQRALGVGIQFLPWAWFYHHQQEATNAAIPQFTLESHILDNAQGF